MPRLVRRQTTPAGSMPKNDSSLRAAGQDDLSSSDAQNSGVACLPGIA
jgi:hypothetical protein